MGQELKFLAPVRPGDTVSATVEVAALDTDKNIAVLRTFCTNQDGVLVVDGQAKVKPPLTPED